MPESFNLIRRVGSLEVSPVVHSYSSVKIYGGQNADGTDRIFQLGDESGAIFEITNEWGSEEQAANILPVIKGFKYQAYESGTVRLDPAAELGDAVTIANTFGGIFSKRVKYGSDIIMSLEAPSKEEVEHEFQVQSPTDRQYARFTASVRADLTLKSDQIKARVEKTVGNKTSDFWWDLQADGWSVGSKSKTIFSVKEGGAEVEGEIRATSGQIGGFTIKDGYLCTNGQDWGGSNSTGIYVGPEGIQCGSKFSVTMGGELTAEKGTFGSLSIGTNQRVSGTYYGGLSDCGGSVSKLGGSLSTGINVGSKKIETYIIDTIESKYADVLVGEFADLTVANNTLDFKKLTVVTGVNFGSQTVSTTTRYFWVTEE